MLQQRQFDSFGSAISLSRGTKPYFSYSGRPISVASGEMAVTLRPFASLTSRSSVWYAMPCRRYSGWVNMFMM